MAGLETAILLALQAMLNGVLVGSVYGILAIGMSLAYGAVGLHREA